MNTASKLTSVENYHLPVLRRSNIAQVKRAVQTQVYKGRGGYRNSYCNGNGGVEWSA